MASSPAIAHPSRDASEADAAPARPRLSPRARTALVVLELAFVLGLLLVWLLSETVRQSNSLWILFLYSFPSEFLVAPVPHEPIFFLFGKLYPAWLVAAVATSSTVLTEALNYSVFQYVADQKFFDKVHQSGITRKLVALFHRAPFVALVVAGLSPVPFYPLRFLVVLARYPLHRYLLAVLVSRAPRFYVLALLGGAFAIPNWMLVVLFTTLILAINVPLVVRLVKNRRSQQTLGTPTPPEK